ncbi:MAG: hypothetical protein UV70_C0005G0060 [Parcubacteria group bacterium GW2011_GWA2_43_13]|nr:MAG: hypothetical protein UV70_C0005G0060 [Parcubacteria group bacterium GW2011_GWA2_43_13]
MSALFLQCHHWHTFQNTVHKQCLSLSPTRRKRPDMLREDTRVVIAMFVFLTCFIIGIPPIEVIATAAGFLTKALPAFLMISLVQIIYAVGMVFSLVTLLNHAGGRAFLERFKIGKELVRLLKHRGVSNHQGLRWLCYEIKYHTILAVYGFLPLTKKIGIARCVLYPKPCAIGAVCLGSIVKIYLLIYPIRWGWKLINGN